MVNEADIGNIQDATFSITEILKGSKYQGNDLTKVTRLNNGLRLDYQLPSIKEDQNAREEIRLIKTAIPESDLHNTELKSARKISRGGDTGFRRTDIDGGRKISRGETSGSTDFILSRGRKISRGDDRVLYIPDANRVRKISRGSDIEQFVSSAQGQRKISRDNTALVREGNLTRKSGNSREIGNSQDFPRGRKISRDSNGLYGEGDFNRNAGSSNEPVDTLDFSRRRKISKDNTGLNEGDPNRNAGLVRDITKVTEVTRTRKISRDHYRGVPLPETGLAKSQGGRKVSSEKGLIAPSFNEVLQGKVSFRKLPSISRVSSPKSTQEGLIPETEYMNLERTRKESKQMGGKASERRRKVTMPPLANQGMFEQAKLSRQNSAPSLLALDNEPGKTRTRKVSPIPTFEIIFHGTNLIDGTALPMITLEDSEPGPANTYANNMITTENGDPPDQHLLQVPTCVVETDLDACQMRKEVTSNSQNSARRRTGQSIQRSLAYNMCSIYCQSRDNRLSQMEANRKNYVS